MVKVKYYDTIEPQSYEVECDTETEAIKWIENEMNNWWEILCDKYPTADVCWLNRLLDVGDTTEMYIPDTSVVVSCTLIYKEDEI